MKENFKKRYIHGKKLQVLTIASPGYKENAGSDVERIFQVLFPYMAQVCFFSPTPSHEMQGQGKTGKNPSD